MTDPRTPTSGLTANEVEALHDPDRWYEAFAVVSGTEARTPEGRRAIYEQWRAALALLDAKEREARRRIAQDESDPFYQP